MRNVRMKYNMPNFNIWLIAILGFATSSFADELSPDGVDSAEKATSIAVAWIKQGPVWYWTNFVSSSSINTDYFGAANINVHEATQEWSVSFWPLEGADPDYKDAQPFNIQVIVRKDGSIRFPSKEDVLHGELPDEGYRVKNERWLKQRADDFSNK